MENPTIFHQRLRCIAFIDEDRIWEHLVKVTREKEGRSANPTYALIDSQSVKTVYASKKRGYDGGKKQKDEKDI